MSRFPFLFLLCAAFIASCGDDNSVPVDEELVEYYERFRVEAAERNVIFDNEQAQVEGYIQNIFDQSILGACRRNADSDNPPVIIVDEPYWKNATDLEREYLVFHELGHCFLQRGHTEAEDDIGVCLSIMASGVGGCTNNYNNTTREEYLDELFNQ